MGLAASRQEAFWEACGFGHVERVKKFLAEDIDVNWKSYTHDCCAIHVASQGKPEIVQMLLDAECDVNVRDDRGNLALHHAAMKGEADIMRTLIKAGSDINAQDKNGWSSLHCAAYWGHPKAVRVLIDAGIDVHLQNKDQRTALHETARSKETWDLELGEITQDLIKAGCDINAKSSDEGEADFTPLMFAAYHGHPVVASALIEAGCEMNARGTNLWTALHWATDRGNEEVVYILLEAGADPTCQGLRGELAAHRAQSNPDLKEMLLNAVNMYNELASLGGAASLSGSQPTTPGGDGGKDAGITILTSPLAEKETLESSEEESSISVTSPESRSAEMSSADCGDEICADKTDTEKLQVDNLPEITDQKLNVRDDSSEMTAPVAVVTETEERDPPQSGCKSSAKGDNSVIPMMTVPNAANENPPDKAAEDTETVIGGGDAEPQREDKTSDCVDHSQKSGNKDCVLGNEDSISGNEDSVSGIEDLIFEGLSEDALKTG